MTSRLVVIGNGMLATRALELIARDQMSAWRISVFGAERTPAYSRVLLSTWLADGCSAHDLELHEAQWYAERNIEVRVGDAVVSVDRDARVVTSASGQRRDYDHLLFATGACVALPAVPGVALPGVEVFRTRNDVSRWLQEPVREVVVVGGGVLGLEAAFGLARQGARVTIVHSAAHLMDRQLDAEAATFVQERIVACGIRVLCGQRCVGVLGDHAAQAVLLANGQTIAAARVVFATGIRPETRLARDCGLACSRGVLVDACMRTSDSNISAIGECAEQDGVCHGLLAPLYDQLEAWTCGLRAAVPAFTPQPIMQTRLKIPGIEVFVAGDLEPHDDVECVCYRDEAAGVYRELRVRMGRLIGVRLCGDSSDAAECVALIRAGTPIDARRLELSTGCEAA